MNIGNIYVNMLCVYMSICLISIHKSAPAHQFTKSANLQDEDWWLRHNNRASCKADPGFCYYVSLSYRARAGQSGSCGSGWFFLIFFWQREWQNLIGSHVYLWVELRWMADVCLMSVRIYVGQICKSHESYANGVGLFRYPGGWYVFHGETLRKSLKVWKASLDWWKLCRDVVQYPLRRAISCRGLALGVYP